MRRCTGVISTSWGHVCSASCALASCNWRGSGLQDARRLPHSPVPNSPAPSPPCPHHAGRGNRGDQTPGPGPRAQARAGAWLRSYAQPAEAARRHPGSRAPAHLAGGISSPLLARDSALADAPEGLAQRLLQGLHPGQWALHGQRVIGVKCAPAGRLHQRGSRADSGSGHHAAASPRGLEPEAQGCCPTIPAAGA